MRADVLVQNFHSLLFKMRRNIHNKLSVNVWRWHAHARFIEATGMEHKPSPLVARAAPGLLAVRRFDQICQCFARRGLQRKA